MQGHWAEAELMYVKFLENTWDVCIIYILTLIGTISSSSFLALSYVVYVENFQPLSEGHTYF